MAYEPTADNEAYEALENLDEELSNYSGGSNSLSEGNENPSYQHPPVTRNQFSLSDEHTYTTIGDTLMRQRMRTAKEVSAGIEDIMMEMPSRTIGRQVGKKAKDRMAAGTTGGQGTGPAAFPHHSYSRKYKYTSTYRRKNRKASQVDIVQEEENIAEDIYAEIRDDFGEVDNSEVKEFAVNMSIKKQIRNRAMTNRDKQRSKNVGCFQLWKYNMSMKWRHTKDRIKRGVGSSKLWDHHLKQVEGNFGSGVASYFMFLRGLFLISIPSFVLNFAFITLPQALEPQGRTNPNVTFTGEEILTGANWLNETLMYYGYYKNGTIEKIPGSKYDMPLAYLLATAGYFVLCLILLVRSTAQNFRRSYIDGQEDRSNFIGKVFCSWNYGIMSEAAAKLQHQTITTELKEILAERQRGDSKRRSVFRKLELFLLRIVTWSIYFLLTGGSMALVFYFNKKFLVTIKTSLDGVKVLPEIMLALIVSTINFVLPIVINAITLFEKYKYPRHQLYVAVFRNFVLKMGLLAVICAFWTAGDLLYDSPDTSNTNLCWETELGQEVYRLVIIDLLVSIVFATFCAEFLRKILAKYFCASMSLPEFSIVNNVMDLIYGQTLCWIGVFFSPLLALIVMFKYFLMFYIKKMSVMQNCQPPTKRWRASQTRTLFNFLLLLSFLFSAIFLCVVVFRLSPSTTCGPYRNLAFTYDVIVNEFDRLAQDFSSNWFAVIMNILVSVWFLYALVTGLLVGIVLAKSKARGYREFSRTLREQIKLEGKDKALLLQWLQNASNQANHLDHNGHPGSSGPPGPRSGGGKHVVPILTRHRDSLASGASSRSGSITSLQTSLSPSNVLTYVDPQHLQSGNLGAGQVHRTNSSGSQSYAEIRKESHKDPLLHKALRNSQRRPRQVNAAAKSTEASVHSNGSTPEMAHASSNPMMYRGGPDRDPQRPASMFVTPQRQENFGAADYDDSDDDGWGVRRPKTSGDTSGIAMSALPAPHQQQARPKSYNGVQLPPVSYGDDFF